MEKIKQFVESFGIKPKNIELYVQALTHKSYANEKKLNYDYQRLEFVGDSIIDAVTAIWLYKKFPKITEGEMSIMRAATVSGVKLSEFAIEIGLDKYIRVGNNGFDFINNSKIISDVFEAFVAAIYFDQGKNEVVIFLEKNVLKFINDSEGKIMKNPKTVLQEYLQLESRGTIEYKNTIIVKGFKSEVFHEGTKFGTGTGKTKKQAEVNAAKDALNIRGRGK